MEKTRASSSLLVLGLMLIVAGAPALAGAENGAPPIPSKRLSASAAAIVAATASTAVMAAQEPATTATHSNESFLKTRRGRVAVAAMALVAGYTIYSRLDNAVHSPAR